MSEFRTPAETAVLESALGHRFRDRALLSRALRHSSYANEVPGVESNERLEFLGDSVLGLVVASQLYSAHPDWSEGDLTRALAELVDQRSLAKLARELGVAPHLRVGRTEELSGGRDKDTILADAVEALLGAVYLDAGLGPVEVFVQRVFAGALAPDAPRVERDPKTRFQEWVMSELGIFPTYELLKDTGIEGDLQRFTVEVRVHDEGWATGVGRSKRLAERAAAVDALGRAETPGG